MSSAPLAASSRASASGSDRRVTTLVERAPLEPNGLSLEHVDCRDDQEPIFSS